MLAFQERLTLCGTGTGVGVGVGVGVAVGVGVGVGVGFGFCLREGCKLKAVELPPLLHPVMGMQNDVKNATVPRIRASLREMSCCKTTVLLTM